MKLLLLLTVAALMSAACYKTSFSGYLKNDFIIESESGTVLAVIMLGSYINKNKVSVWADKATGKLFRESEKKLEYGIFNDASVIKYTGKSENGLNEAVVNIPVNKDFLADNIQSAFAEPEKTYYEHCSTCHSATNISRYSEDQWNSILKSMIEHTDTSESEFYQIKRYVTLILNN